MLHNFFSKSAARIVTSVVAEESIRFIGEGALRSVQIYTRPPEDPGFIKRFGGIFTKPKKRSISKSVQEGFSQTIKNRYPVDSC